MERCRTLWAEGRTASHIAQELGTSRSSVLSKVRRSGWTSPYSMHSHRADALKALATGRPAIRTRRAPAPSPPRKAKPKPQPQSQPRPAAGALLCEPVEAADANVIVTTSFAVAGFKRLEQLEAEDCRWPIGECGVRTLVHLADGSTATIEGAAFCAAQRVHDSVPYCATHSRIAYTPATGQRREYIPWRGAHRPRS